MKTKREVIPRKIKQGERVIVKFDKDTIGYRYQGPGWHEATLSYIGDTSNYVVIHLTNPTDRAKELYAPDNAVIVEFKFGGSKLLHLNKQFFGTIIRKIVN